MTESAISKDCAASWIICRISGSPPFWLLPFYPSPLRDDGYDIADCKDIHPAYGTMADFKAFLREAHRRGIRVITELIFNHTSDQHPWFQRARLASRAEVRNYYVWSDADRSSGNTHHFQRSRKIQLGVGSRGPSILLAPFLFAPAGPEFRQSGSVRTITEVMEFWLDLGVDGMRLDAVPYLIEREGTINENLPETHELLRRLRRELDMR